MKHLILAILITLQMLTALPLAASAPVEYLQQSYRNQGDAFFIPLYWLPETRQIVIKHIPDHSNWVGFEMALWKKLTEEQKQQALAEIGTELARPESPHADTIYQRIRDWQNISTQLGLLGTFFGEEEGFLDLAFTDPALTPVFQWILERRPTGFDSGAIGATFSSGERAEFFPVLVAHLLGMQESQRLQCFSRLFTRIAEVKAATAKPE